MATVTGYTSAKMNEMRDANITSAYVSNGTDGFSNGDLILVPFGWATDPVTYPKINLGDVTGPQGIQGPTGEVTTAALNAAIADVEAQIAAAHATGAISQAMLADLAVSTAKLANLAVTTAKIADLNVTEGKIASGAVTETKIGPGAVTETKIGNGAVTLAKMAANSVDSAQYVDGSIDSVHIGNDQINSQHYAAGSIDPEHLASAAVTYPKLSTLAGRGYNTTNFSVLLNTWVGSASVTLTATAGSLLVVSGTVDINWVDPTAEDFADLVEARMVVNGVALSGELVLKPYRVAEGSKVTRLSASKLWVYTLPSALSSDLVELQVQKTSNINTVTCMGGSSGVSNTTIDYVVFKA